jgi:hypothetical protein
MSRKHKILIAATVFLVIVVSGWFGQMPLRRSESSIRASLLKQTPLGSTLDEVRAFIERKGWLETNYIGSTGFHKQEGKGDSIVGVTSIRGELGHYRELPKPWPFETDVTAFWGFDKDGRLIDVWVWKTMDSL